MKEILLSVIIPCYNSFKSMERCLRSLERQTTSVFEVIIIDDSSTDSSFDYLLDYQTKSNLNLHVYRNEINVGAGVSRNKGIKEASGKYIMFLDADDYLNVNCIKYLNDILETNAVDCVIFDYFISLGVKKRKRDTLSKKKGYLKKEDILIYITGCPWCKVYLRSIIIENNILFGTLKINEDMPFTKLAIYNCNTFYYLPYPLYNYVMNVNSLMHNNSFLNENNAKQAFSIIQDSLSKKYKQETEAIWIKEVLYSTTITLIKLGRDKRYIVKYISELETSYPMWRKNRLVIGFPVHTRFCVWLIKKRLLLILYYIITVREKIKSKGQI